MARCREPFGVQEYVLLLFVRLGSTSKLRLLITAHRTTQPLDVSKSNPSFASDLLTAHATLVVTGLALLVLV
jgi:hypothetical protein